MYGRALETHRQLEHARLLPVAAAKLRVVRNARGGVAGDGDFGAQAQHGRVLRYRCTACLLYTSDAADE